MNDDDDDVDDDDDALCMWRQSGSVEGVIRKYGSRDVCWSSQGMLRLSTDAMRRLFQPTLERIKQAIGDVLNHPNARGTVPTSYEHSPGREYWNVEQTH